MRVDKICNWTDLIHKVNQSHWEKTWELSVDWQLHLRYSGWLQAHFLWAAFLVWWKGLCRCENAFLAAAVNLLGWCWWLACAAFVCFWGWWAAVLCALAWWAAFLCVWAWWAAGLCVWAWWAAGLAGALTSFFAGLGTGAFTSLVSGFSVDGVASLTSSLRFTLVFLSRYSFWSFPRCSFPSC